MRSLRRLMLTLISLLILAAIIPFALPLKDGRPLLDWRQLTLPSLPSLPSVSMPEVALPGSGSDEPASVTVYRWRDSDGVWQFGSAPPSTGAYETVTVDPNTNLIAAPAPAPVAPPKAAEPVAARKEPTIESPYSPDGVKKMMDDAKRVRDMMEDRNETLRQISGG